MPNVNYERGRAMEYHVKRVLERLGYLVTRAAASQGVFDLVALGRKAMRHPHAAVAVQVKRGQRPPSPSEWRSAVESDVQDGTCALVLYFPPMSPSGHVLWCNIDPLPAWMAQVRWLKGLPIKQMAFRNLTPRPPSLGRKGEQG